MSTTEVENEKHAAEDTEKVGRLRYATAVRLATVPFWTRVVAPIKWLWATLVEGPGGDIADLLMRYVTYHQEFYNFFHEEFFSMFLEIRDLPVVMRLMWRKGSFSVPIREIKSYFSVLGVIKKDFFHHWQFTANDARLAYNSQWSMRGKVYFGGVFFLTLLTIYNYKLHPWPRHNSKKEVNCLHKTVVITGSSAGIGFRLAYEFLKRGAFVIITSPDMIKARKARVELTHLLYRHHAKHEKIFESNAKVRYLDQVVTPYQLDIQFLLQNIVEMDLNLASTASIYSFVRKLQGLSPQGIDILINNAAMNCPPDEMVVTDEGKEAHFAINYFGHFVLTNLLLGLLAKRKGARIINVTCRKGLKHGFLNLDEFIEPYLQDDGLPYLPAEEGYINSKLAMYLFNRQLAKELQLSNLNNVTAYSVCPGTTKTFLNRYMRVPSFCRVLYAYGQPFHKTIYYAAQPILHCALSEKCAHESGFFYENNRRSRFRSNHEKPDEVAQRLWDASRTLMLVSHQAMLKLTEQMHVLSHENIFQLANNLFLHRRDVMTHLLLMEEQQAFKTKHEKWEDERGDARTELDYVWNGFYLTGGEDATIIERWVLNNAHAGFKELQKEYDVWFECTGSAHYHPKNNGKIASLQYMNSFAAPLDQDDIEELEDLYESDSEPEDENLPLSHGDYIRMEEYVDKDY